MFLTLENMIGLLSVFGAVVFFVGYRCGKSDQRDAEERARIVENLKPGKPVRGSSGN